MANNKIALIFRNGNQTVEKSFSSIEKAFNWVDDLVATPNAAFKANTPVMIAIKSNGDIVRSFKLGEENWSSLYDELWAARFVNSCTDKNIRTKLVEFYNLKF